MSLDKDLVHWDRTGFAIDDWSGEFEFLRNNYECDILYEGITYPSVEHAFQASKTDDENIRLEISEAQDYDARRIGRHLPLSSDWDSKRLTVMEQLINIKFQDPQLATLLIATNDAPIEMGNTRDSFWGVGDGSGTNYLGKIIMKVRDILIMNYHSLKNTPYFKPSEVRPGGTESIKIPFKNLLEAAQKVVVEFENGDSMKLYNLISDISIGRKDHKKYAELIENLKKACDDLGYNE